jgi:three-Cys-motif partner protein
MSSKRGRGARDVPSDASWDNAFFQEEKKVTSRIKHQVLEAYIEKFSYHMTEVLYYIDGFAGPGGYRTAEGLLEPGSPVLAAQVGERVHASKPQFNLRCINVEENPSRYRQLMKATAPYRPHIVEENYPGRFTDYILDILERIKEWPAFFFIDPFGTKGVAFTDLLPVLNRGFTTEVLVTLHTAGIAKKAGYFAWMEDNDIRKRRIGTAQTANLAAALAVPHDELRKWWGLDPVSFEKRVLEHYLHQLRMPHTRMQFTKAFPVYYTQPSDGFGPGGSGRVCFYLVFGTQNKTGLYVMNDCMVKAMGAFIREAYKGTLFEFSPPEPDRRAALVALEEEIVRHFAGRPFTIDEVKRMVMQETLLLLPQGDYRDVVQRMARECRLTKMDAGRPKNDTTRFGVAS